MKLPSLKTTLVAIAIFVLILIVASVIVYAVYVMTSDTVDVNVASQATLSLTVDKTSIIAGESITLTATASDGAICAGVSVDFKEGTNTLTTVSMNTAGVATYIFAPSAGLHTYYATATHP